MRKKPPALVSHNNKILQKEIMKTKSFFIIIILVNLLNISCVGDLSDSFVFIGHPDLHLAVQNNNIEEVKRLLTKEGWKEMNIKSNIYWTKKINIDLESFDGTTALFHAQSLEMAVFLIGQGADIKVTNHDRETVLHQVKNIDIAKLFLEKGLNINIRKKGGSTSYDMAYLQGRLQVANFLRSQGAFTKKELDTKRLTCSCFYK